MVDGVLLMKTLPHFSALGLALALIGSWTGVARSEFIPTLFNTGLTDARTLLAEGSVDPHYQLVSSPDALFPGPSAFVVLSTGHPIANDWFANGPDSQWIAPQANQDENNGGGNEPGSYTYRTTFDLTGFDLSRLSIVGRWSMDNSGTDILINGVSTGISYPADNGYQAFHDFKIGSGFISGINTLDFVIVNAGGPTGLRVEMIGTIPEPGSLTLAVIGGAGIIVMCWRRKPRLMS